jgi:hypothetical protein
MSRLLSGIATSLTITLWSVSGLWAQPQPPAPQAKAEDEPPERKLGLLRPPQTPEDLWGAAAFSLAVGRADFAADYLDKLLASDMPADLLIKIREEQGATTLSKMLAVRELRDKAATLIRRADQAARDRATDPERIQKFIAYLTRTAQHRAYGVQQLRSAGADAIPHLVQALTDPQYDLHRPKLIDAMKLLDSATLPPLLAALESESEQLLIDLLPVVSALGDRDVAAALRYYAESPSLSANTREVARTAVTRILHERYDNLPTAEDVLLALARRYYDHQAKLRPNADGTVRLWLWVPREGLKAETVSASYAEEHAALGLCRQILRLNPNSQAAHVLMVMVALDKAVERVGADQPLPEGPGRAGTVATAAGPDLLGAALRKALDENRPHVAVAAARLLSQTADRSALREIDAAQSPLLAALRWPDRRVQFAAAEAVLSLEPKQPFSRSRDVCEILARALAAQAAPRAVLIDSSAPQAAKLASIVREAGFEPEVATTGRDGFAAAAQASDVEMILIEPNVVDPTLSALLPALRGDSRTAGIPVFLVAPLNMQSSLAKFEHRFARVKFLVRPANLAGLNSQVKPYLDSLRSKPLTAVERTDHARRAAEWLARVARGEVAGIDPLPAEAALLAVARDETLGPVAMAALSRLGSDRVQTELAEVVLDTSVPAALRLAAARELAHCVRQLGVQLKATHVADLRKALDAAPDPALHQALAAALGAMKPGRDETSRRLRGYATPAYEPPAPAAEPATPAAPMEKPDTQSAPTAPPPKPTPAGAKPEAKPEPDEKPAEKPAEKTCVGHPRRHRDKLADEPLVGAVELRSRVQAHLPGPELRPTARREYAGS